MMVFFDSAAYKRNSYCRMYPNQKTSNQDLFGYFWWNLDVLCTNMRMVCL